jgi:hypothetical protein
MSKKNLLKEGTVRKFMQYANIGGLSDGFIQENYLPEEEEEEMDFGDEEGMGDEPPVDDMADMGDEPPVDDMADMGDMDDMGDMEGEGSMEDTSEDSVAGLVDAIADAISDYTGVDVSSEQTGAEELDELPPAEGGEELPADQGLGEVPPEGGEDLDGVEVDDEPDEEEIIAETMKRVTRRIRSMQKREKLAETVTNRIMKKISKQNRRKR